jgi:wyosine [tRNA(Phe)-imidazoG37] synthetase (radical SAM superfamily)
LRNEYAPLAKVSVLTNSTRIFDASVADALKMADNNILKLDSAIESTMRAIDRPTDKNFTVQRVVEALKLFSGEAIIQTLFVRGEHDGEKIDNTTPEEVEALIEAYKAIQPKEVMVYSIDRTTPEENLIKVPREELEEIAIKIRAAGINTQVN